MNTPEPQKNRTRLGLVISGFLFLLAGIVAFLLVSKDELFAEPSSIPWVIFAVLGLLIVLGIVAIFVARNNPQEPDYRAFFTLGLILMIIGFSADNTAMWPIGIVFFIIGFVNRDKWKKQKKWSEMSKGERNLKLGLILGLGVLVLLGVAVFFVQGAAQS